MRPDTLEDIYELTPLQHGMLVHTLADTASGLYFEQLCFELEGPLDADALHAAWREVIARHAALRTAVQWEDLEKPYQVVYRQVDVPWSYLDWSGFSIDDQHARLQSLLAADRSRGFVISEAPLLRLTLVRLGDHAHQLIWSLHHLILDGWSWPLVMNELIAFYEASRENRTLVLAKPRPYRDFIAWLQKRDHSRSEGFWREYLAGFGAPTPIGGTRAQGDGKASEGFGRERRALSVEATRSLQLLAQQHQLTLNTFVQGAWALLLRGYSANSDVLFGAIAAGRPPDLEGAESMVGLFINTLPVRVRIDSEVSVLEFLRRLQAEQVNVREHEFTPLLDVHGWSQVPRKMPLFESLVAFENYPASGDHGSSATFRIRDIKAYDLTNYPLTAAVMPGPTLTIELIYDRARFDRLAVVRMLGHFESILAGMAADPERNVGAVALLTDAERQQLTEWNNTDASYPETQCLHELFEQHAAATPDKDAVVLGDSRLSYGAFNARANQLAHYLAKRGVGPEVRVGISMERSLDMMVALLGVLKAGAAYVPLDPAYPESRLEHMRRDSGMALLLTSSAIAPTHANSTVPVVIVDRDAEQIADEDTSNPRTNVTPANLAYVIYTSGSTGLPKGVMVEHRGLSNLAEAQLRAFGLSADDRVLQFASLSFDASIFEIAMAFKTGATIVLASAVSLMTGAALYDVLQREKITNLTIPPSVLSSMPEGELPSLRIIVVAGEACGADVVDRWAPGRRLFNCYGPTETTVWATFEECYAGSGRPSIGRPIANTRIYILDRDLQPVPVGVAGELHIAGVGVARGYLNRPDLTSERFVASPFDAHPHDRLYKTGDLARYLSDGRIDFLGRLDHQIKLRGFRIESGEIEAVLDSHEAVLESVVIAREDTPGNKRLVAYVVVSGHASVVDELRAALKRRLPTFMVPAAIVVLSEMPLTPNGKIDRAKLPIPESMRTGGESVIQPATALEKTIAEAWKSVLGVENIGREDNFFDLGGHSLLITRLYSQLKDAVPLPLSVVDLFEYPTVRALAEHLAGQEQSDAKIDPHPRDAAVREPVAIVGMAGRFPRAASVDELWRNLRAGVEAIQLFSDEELLRAGVDAGTLSDPNYVKAGTVLDGFDLFDAAYFGVSPREAEIMDPQHRLFLECAQEALDAAGIDPHTVNGRIGLFAGSSLSNYLLKNLLSNPYVMSSGGTYQAYIGNDKDFLPSTVSYKLNLKGPSVTVQTACSTSLVAVHMSCESLLAGDCDIAMAGGVTVAVPQPSGYFYQEQGIASPDGHCRVFDGDAAGTYPSSGVAVVVLKRLSRALADGDQILALIRGSAINNDGSAKVGYTAPSVDGQTAVILSAHAAAGVSADSISYVEAHGTGTPLGDPIEMAALTKAFRRSTDRTAFCAVGSLKSNMGHLDAAAGIAGLVKTVLQLRHQEIVSSLNFRAPNPKINFGDSPFFVNTKLQTWKRSAGTPRRAGVSSFGIGGTNAHVILEEPPAPAASGPARGHHVLLVSAKTESALARASERLAEALQQDRSLFLADVAYTTQVGRTAHAHRRAIISTNTDEAVAALLGRRPERVWTARSAASPGVAFMFPGQGAQYVGMGRELYESERAFREEIDRCAEVVRPYLNGRDLKTLLYPASSDVDAAERALADTAITQPAMFVVAHALAKLWMSWGIQPVAMIGHSIGEYVAASIAGVMSADDALRLVALRGALMQKLPAGAMLAVELAESAAEHLVGADLSIAAVNGPDSCVLSGPVKSLDEVERLLAERGISARRLRTSHAFHSAMMEPILAEFTSALGAVTMHPPRIPYISNVTGTWIHADEATSPEYWARHLRERVRFGDGVTAVLANAGTALLEVGPGQVLSTLARRQPVSRGRSILSSLPRPNAGSEIEALLTTVARLWVSGVHVDWPRFHEEGSRRRVTLPGYPFERQRYWIEPTPESTRSRIGEGRAKLTDWLYIPSWKRSVPTTLLGGETQRESASWLVFADRCGVGTALAQRLRAIGHHVTLVSASSAYEVREPRHIAIRPDQSEDHERVLREGVRAAAPNFVVHLWTLDYPADGEESPDLERAQALGFDSLLAFARAVGNPVEPVRMTVVTSETQKVTGDDTLRPEKATILGASRVIPQEFKHLTVRTVDVRMPSNAYDVEDLVENLIREAQGGPDDSVIAYRGGYRWTQVFEPAHDVQPHVTNLRPHGVYLITGGTGGIGLTLAEHLARRCAARLTLTSRTPLPARDEWESWLAAHDAQDAIGLTIRKLQALESHGAQVQTLAFDASSGDALRQAVMSTRERFGEINGIIHCAGVASAGMIQFRQPTARQTVFGAKVKGAQYLADVVDDRVDFVVLCSSLSSVLGGIGQADYCAANNFLDALAQQRAHGPRAVFTAINWDRWRDVGMAAKAAPARELVSDEEASLGLSADEGAEVFERVLRMNVPQVVVSTGDLARRIDTMRSLRADSSVQRSADAPGSLHPRPIMQQEFAPPQSDLERKVQEIWQRHLGIDRIGVHDNFFELGGHSLLLLRVQTDLSRLLDSEIAVAELLRCPTIRSLAAALDSDAGEPIAIAVEERALARIDSLRQRRHLRGKA